MNLILFIYVPLLAVAASINNKSPYEFRSIKPASNIHLNKINANGGYFWIGKPTTSYCPLFSASLCPKGIDTSFYVDKYGFALLVSR